MNIFKLSIELGNDAMESPAHVAEALRELATKVEALEADTTTASGRVADDNGNICGKWAYKNDDAGSDDDEDDDS